MAGAAPVVGKGGFSVTSKMQPEKAEFWAVPLGCHVVPGAKTHCFSLKK
jgi:hypothetical protein